MRGAKYKIALMPESWLKKAIRMASRIGFLRRLVQKCPDDAFSDDAAMIASASVAISAFEASGSIRCRTCRPASRSPFLLSSQRGLSGSPKHSTA